MTEQAPRLRVGRLVIVQSRSPVSFIRDVRLHAGLNIVWAQEPPVVDGAASVQTAGHGVGKSTFSLMLRAVLGDDGAAVKTMRAHLADHFADGGIAAEVLSGGERFAVYRSFGSHSYAVKGGTVEGLFESEKQALDFSEYLGAIGESACLGHLQTRTLPVTNQAIEWAHVLCWMARDQGLGLRHYYQWRSDDGTGLRRKAKDPPSLVRVVLGLLTDAEAKAEQEITGLTEDMSKACETLKFEEQRGANVRSLVESQLRQWAGVSSSLQVVANDLFSDSVEKEIQRKTRQLEAKNQEDSAAIQALGREVVELEVEIREREPIVELAKNRWEESIALLNNDEKALKEIRDRRDSLLVLSGTCGYGNISYGDCVHVKSERETVSLRARRDAGALSKTVGELQERAQAEQRSFERQQRDVADIKKVLQQKNERQTQLKNEADARMRQLGRSDAIRESLAQWQDSRITPETKSVREARKVVAELEAKADAAKMQRLSAQQQVSESAQRISRRADVLARAFGASGRYVPLDEKRPFQLLGADGEAYAVLENVLGDLACALDGAESESSAHPGFLIFDCPREADLSPQLYARFLELVGEIAQATPALQVIITTTTPPPVQLQTPPTCVLTLSRASDDGLLLKCRLENLLSRTGSPPTEGPP